MKRWLLLTLLGAFTFSPALAQQLMQDGSSTQSTAGAPQMELQRPDSRSDALRQQERLLDDIQQPPQSRLGSSGQERQSAEDDEPSSRTALQSPDGPAAASAGLAAQPTNADSRVAGPGDLVPPVSANELDISSELGRRGASD